MRSLFTIKKLLKNEQNRKKINLQDIEYFNCLTNDKIYELINGKFVACDFNEKALIYMSDESENIYKYTSSQYYTETKQTKLKRVLNNALNKNNEESYYRALWREHQNKIKSFNKMVVNVKQKYGDNIIIIVGDMSGGEADEINSQLLDVLAHSFTVYKINEYKTSCVNCRTFETNKNYELSNNHGNKYIVTSVFTYTCKNGRKGWINRDRNAVVNMIYIVDYWIELFLFLTEKISVDECRFICHDKRLHQFINKTPLTDININNFLLKNGRPIQFI